MKIAVASENKNLAGHFGHCEGIEIVTGATGGTEENAKRYIAGKLESTGSVCREHQNQGSCGEHGGHEEHGNHERHGNNGGN